MRTPGKRLMSLLLLLIAGVALALVACGGDDDDETATPSGGGDGGSDVTGTVSIEGSSTVQPFTIELIDAFKEAYPDVTVNPPSGLGSGAGITAFINEEVDIAQASRQIKSDEIEQAEAAGLDPFETTILRDALAIVVHPDNPVTQLTEEQVAMIFAGDITNWSEVGGNDEDITVFTRNEESGTFAYMEEDVIQKVLGDDAEYAADINKQANAPSGLGAVAGETTGIFYAGLGNLADLPDPSVVKVLNISADDASEAVLPSADTVAAGTYPISRGLYYYTDGDPAQSDNAGVKAFVEFALSADGQAIGEELNFLRVDGMTSSDGGSAVQPTATEEMMAVEGTITFEGSSTVQPFTIEAIDAFQQVYPDVTINPPSGLGSGAGITAFINQEVDIAQASRAIKPDEIDQAKAAGLDPYETTILRDALAIVVHPDNPVDQLTEEQVAKIFAGEITNWSEVGGNDEDITVFTRNEESGTFAYMEEDVIQKVLGGDAEYAADINKQANAPSGLGAVAGESTGIFYAGLGNLADLPDPSVVKVVKVSKDDASEAVEPSAETVASGSYPIARSLYYYTDGDPIQSDNAALVAWFEFVLGPDGQAIGEELNFLPVGPTS
jgi:phosphate transport system substrate-binding protein